MKLALPHDPSSAPLARRTVREACRALLAGTDEAALCASELVANSLLHGQPPLVLEIVASPRTVRVSVSDGGTSDIEPRPGLAADTLSGRGLVLVEALSARWGVERNAAGNVVWFEMDRPREQETRSKS